MGLFDGLFGGDDEQAQTVKSEPWLKAQPYLLDILARAQAQANQPMQSWGMMSMPDRMAYAQHYMGADMLGTPMPGAQPPPPGPIAPQPQPTAPQTQRPVQSQQPGAPQNLPTKEWLRSQSSANFSAPVMVYDPSEGVVMYKGDGSGGWMRDIGAIARPSSGRGGSGAEEAAAAAMSRTAAPSVAAPSMPGLSAGAVAQQGPNSMAPSSASGWSGLMSGYGPTIAGAMLGLAAGGPAGMVGGGVLGTRLGNWWSNG